MILITRNENGRAVKAEPKNKTYIPEENEELINTNVIPVDLDIYNKQTDGQALVYWIDNTIKPVRKILMDAQQWRIDRYNRDVFLGNTPTDDIEELHNYMESVKVFPDNLTEIKDDLVWPPIP